MSIEQEKEFSRYICGITTYTIDNYTKDGDKVKKVSFGAEGMAIKTKDPDRRRNFRARHNCDNPGPKTKARYWSCRMWSGPDAIKKMQEK